HPGNQPLHLGHDLRADAVAGNEEELVGHAIVLRKWWKMRRAKGRDGSWQALVGWANAPIIGAMTLRRARVCPPQNLADYGGQNRLCDVPTTSDAAGDFAHPTTC